VLFNDADMDLTVDMFETEIGEALKAFDKFVVCLDKSTPECEDSLKRLVKKAIDAYESRAPGLRHGIALDRQVTVIMSQTDSGKPLCAIYFNLSSPYHKGTPASVGKEK